MRLTALRDTPARRELTDVFGGYDRRPGAGENTWYDQRNMTGGDYPALSTRRRRRTVAAVTEPGGLLTKDALAVVAGTAVLYNGAAVELGLNDQRPKQLISMGAYLLIWPDKKYLNTHDLSDKGSLERTFTLGDGVTLSARLCRPDGTDYGTYTAGDTPPPNPSGGALWMDTSGQGAAALKEWNAESESWVVIPNTCLKLTAAGIAQGFAAGDGVEIAGLTGALAPLNGGHVLQALGPDWLAIPGVLSAAATQSGGVTVARTVPDMDFVTECGNRIWGCKYGMVAGKTVNEIYASALGDFKNWRRFQGLSTDSYAASRGSDGVFTAAVTHLGHPLFFKENCIEKVYPDDGGAHRIVTVEGRGVQRGCWRSAAIVGETLYYKSRAGICAYTGSLPRTVSEPLGEQTFDDARAGAAGEVYTVSMRRDDGTWHLFTYDTARRLWHRQDDTRALMFAAVDGVLHWIDEDTGKLMAADGVEEEDFTWSATSGVLGCGLAENEYVSRFVIRADTRGTIHLAVRYDEEADWQDKGSYTGRGLGSFVLAVPPRRCDHLRLRLSGRGQCRLLSVAKTVERGSDVFRSGGES